MKDFALLFLRIVVGGGFVMHGFQKLGVEGAMDAFTANVEAMGIPLAGVSAWAAALSECVGGGFLVLGLVTRVAALPPAIVMIVAITKVHWGDPVDAGWISSGIELALLYLAGCLTLAGTGAGAASIDHMLFKRT